MNKTLTLIGKVLLNILIGLLSNFFPTGFVICNAFKEKHMSSVPK